MSEFLHSAPVQGVEFALGLTFLWVSKSGKHWTNRLQLVSGVILVAGGMLWLTTLH